MTPQLNTDATGFTNTSPAIHGNTIFVTLRNYLPRQDNGTLRAPPTGSSGAIVAIDLTTGARKWAFQMPARSAKTNAPASINTRPLIFPSQNAVIFGDVNGEVYSLDMTTGAPRPIFIKNGVASHILDILDDGKLPARGQTVWSQVSGAGTEPSASSGTMDENAGKTWLMVGANWYDPALDSDGHVKKAGRLLLIPMGVTYNLKWVDTQVRPERPWKAGERITVSGTVRLENTSLSLKEIRSAPDWDIKWYLVPRGWVGGQAEVAYVGSSPLPPTLRGGETHTITDTFTIPNVQMEQGDLVGIINAREIARDLNTPEGVMVDQLPGAASSATFTPNHSAEMLPYHDNIARLTFERQVPVDLSVTTPQVSGTVACMTGFNVSWSVLNSSSRSQTANYKVWVEKSGDKILLRDGVRQFNPGSNPDSQTVWASACDTNYVIYVQVNLPKPGTVEETDPTDYANNAASHSVHVGRMDLPAIGGFEQGTGEILIVPADCQTNPDRESRRPCLNYPDLVLP